MKYTKQPIDITAQIAILKERGLLIPDEAEALRQLRIISYFRLANYWKPMEADKAAHTFKHGSTFAGAISLYYFDKRLRALLFSAIQSIEVAMRAVVIRHVSMKYGAFWFADSNLFKGSRMFQENLLHIEQELKRSKEDFIQEHFAKYDNPAYPPVWKTLEVVSFGTLSKLYDNLSDNKVKKAIAREFSLPQHIYLESWIKSIAALRNCVAHHGRVWNRRYPLKPQLPQKLALPWIAVAGVQPTKLYAQLCCLAYLQDRIHAANTFKQELMSLLKDYPNVDVAAMGFPNGWQREALWQI